MIKLEVREGYEDLRYHTVNTTEPSANIVTNSFPVLFTLAQAQFSSRQNLKRLVKYHLSYNDYPPIPVDLSFASLCVKIKK
ncbi:unnamed protein product [Didymodactylos carnosus]|uniref:Uncharacterized protein n=1 Tax=Didymodactylos carnosus TaxID=1234261 RepID=A0A815Y7V9_9BILA|nr:unnamed protein product [Didymodactylos carnosus]CAF4429544.1 unnamed protein product [Didymodactylos carnosus]